MIFYSLSDVGLNREKNEDNYLTITNANNDLLAVVCDGVGGSNAGDVASNETCLLLADKFKDIKFNSSDDVKRFIYDEVEHCNKHLLELSKKYKEYHGMATTITGLLITSFGDYVFNVGDSRTYAFEENDIIQITEDHSLMNEMIKRGEITYEESLTHPKRHYVTSCLGINTFLPKLDVFETDFNCYLLCSDGLCGYVNDQELLNIYLEKKTAQATCEAFINTALLKGGYDNITAIIVKK